MPDNVGLNTFPSDEYEALAYLYVKAQDLSGKAPEDMVEMYNDAYDRILEKRKSIRDKKIAARNL